MQRGKHLANSSVIRRAEAHMVTMRETLSCFAAALRWSGSMALTSEYPQSTHP
jgi:hypothetical protein